MPDRVPPLPDVGMTAPTGSIALRDGRSFAWTEWGDPQGFPAFYFHGTPSSRLEGALADGAARRHGFRLIATDRPGMGLSTFQAGRRFRHWPDDICELADALRIERFGVVGHSGAGPHLFVCGAVITPARLAFIGGLAPWGPVATPEILQSLNSLDRFYLGLSRRWPALLRVGFAPLGWCARFTPRLFFRLLRDAVSPASKPVFDDAAFVAHFERIEAEAFRQGSRGAAHEAGIAFGAWDFELSDVRVPTHIWLGEQDIFVPRRMGEYLERNIPQVDVHWVADSGHFDIDNWDAIFAACSRHVAPRPESAAGR